MSNGSPSGAREQGRPVAVTRRAAVTIGLGGLTAALLPPQVARAATRPDGPVGGVTTLERTILRTAPDRTGWRRHLLHPGEGHVVRTELADAAASRVARRRPVGAFVHLTDVHVQDTQSPARFEFIDRYRDGAGVPQYGGSYRPHDVLTTQVAESSVQAVNAVRLGPATGLPLAFAVSTGDAADSCQHNELRWMMAVLDGGRVAPDSGLPGEYEGVGGTAADPAYWHPEGAGRDDYRSRWGFPAIPGLLAAATSPFEATGLDLPWFAAHGNHEGVVRGGFERSGALAELAVGATKPAAMRGSLTAPAFVDRLMRGDSSVLRQLERRDVTADPARRLVDRAELVAEHFRTTGTPVGHGFTEGNRREGTAYYAQDAPLAADGSGSALRIVVLDSVNEHGDGDGSLDHEQFEWLRRTLDAEPHRPTAVFSHHTTASMGNARTAGRAAPRVLGDRVVRLLLGRPQVLVWVNGHVHRNAITPHRADGRRGGFWEITTASHIDWPQQFRTVELADNGDGTLSVFATLVDTAAPASWDGSLDSPLALAALSRELAANDPSRWDRPRAGDALYRGAPADRNAELLLPRPDGLLI